MEAKNGQILPVPRGDPGMATRQVPPPCWIDPRPKLSDLRVNFATAVFGRSFPGPKRPSFPSLQNNWKALNVLCKLQMRGGRVWGDEEEQEEETAEETRGGTDRLPNNIFQRRHSPAALLLWKCRQYHKSSRAVDVTYAEFITWRRWIYGSWREFHYPVAGAGRRRARERERGVCEGRAGRVKGLW